jgi:tape measure domain-containing protein
LEEGEIMSPTVDDRIVSLKFDNAQFEQKMTQTLAQLDKLTQKLSFVGAGQGFANIQQAANSVNLEKMAAGVDKISSRFDVLGAIGFSAIQKITQSVMGFVGQFAAQDILGPLITGGKERATNIEQAQFQFRGLGMDVQQVMSDALGAVKGTAYGLGDAAKAAAQFGASGITAGADMQQSLRAIAGTAAMTSTNFSDMAYLFTTSAAMGKVTNMDFQQFATRGLNAAAAYGKQMNLTEAQVHDLASKGQISYKEFAAAMDAAFGAHATAANETYTGSLANLHAAMSRIGAAWFGPSMQQSRDIFNALIPVIDTLNSSLQPLITSFLGIKQSITTGLIDTFKNLNTTSWSFIFQSIGDSLKNVFDFLQQVGSIAKSAWDAIFPRDLGVSILLIVQGIERFTASLKMGGETADKVKSIFQGFFSILSIAWEIIKGVGLVISDVVKALFPASSGFLNVAASIGDFLTKMHDVLVTGGKIHDFFARLGDIISAPAAAIGEFVSKITSFFKTSPDESGVLKPFNSISTHIDKIGDQWQRFMDRLQGVFDVLGKVWDGISNWFSQLWQKIADAIGGGDYNAVADVLNVGILGAIAVMLKNFTSGGLRVGLGGGVFGVIQSNLIAITRTLNQMQAKIQADTIFKIAGAIGILAVSLAILASIDSEKLTKAIGAMSVGMGELVAVMKILQASVKSFTGAASIAIISGAMISVAIAMGILSTAIKNLSTISWEGLAKGLTGVGVGLGILVAASKMLAGNAGGMVAAGVGMIAMSIGLRILADVVQEFSKLSWEAIGKGLAAVGVGLGLLIVAMKLMPASSAISGLGLIEMAVGLRIIADVVQEFGKLSWEAIGKGLAGIAGGLLAITAAMNFMPITLPITAAGLVILSVALRIMASAITTIGQNDMGSLAKGIGGLAAALLVLVLATNAMSGSILGATAVAIVSVALNILADVMTKLGSLSIMEIVKSLGAIAAVLVVLGLAAAVLEPVIPAMLLLGAALGLIGGAFALFGLGAMMVATSFQLMAVAGVAGTAALLKSLEMIMKAIPQFAAAAALLVISFAEEMLKGMPTFIKVIRAVLEQLLLTVIKEVPLIVKALGAIIDGFIVLIVTRAPEIIQTAFFLLITFLQGLRDNMYQLITVGAEIIVNFLAGLTSKIPDLVAAAANLIVTFLNELANHIGEIMAAGTNVLVQFLLGIANNIAMVVQAVGTIIITFVTEVGNQAGQIVTAGVNVIIKFIEGLAQNAVRLAMAAGKTILDFLTGLDQAIRIYEPQIIAMALQIGIDIIAGIFRGISDLVQWGNITGWIGGLGKKIQDLFIGAKDWLLDIGYKIMNGLFDGLKKAWHEIQDFFGGIGSWIKSHKGPPAKDAVLLFGNGMLIINGLLDGMKSGWGNVEDWVNNLDPTKGLIDTKNLSSVFAKMASQLSDMGEFNPTITPVLDLTKVQETSENIAGLLATSPITPSVSLQHAGVISSATTSAGAEENSTGANSQGQVNFYQTNNSPAALSTDDIYRNTRSQIALARRELGIS